MKVFRKLMGKSHGKMNNITETEIIEINVLVKTCFRKFYLSGNNLMGKL